MSWLAFAEDAGLHCARPLLPFGGQLPRADELDARGGGSADRARRGDHDRLSQVGPDLGLVVLLLGEGSGGFAVVLAYLVKCVFDGFPVQDAVAAIDPFPGAEGAELRCGDRRLNAEAVQVLR